MLAFSCSLVFAQQDHPPLKKNMLGYEEAKPFSSYQKEQLKDGYITAHKNKLTSAQKDS